MSDPVPTLNRAWKYGWDVRGKVVTFRFVLADLLSLPEFDPVNYPGLRRSEDGFYIYSVGSQLEMTLPHSLFKWVAPSGQTIQETDSVLWVRRPNGITSYLVVTNEADPQRNMAHAYVASQDYKLSLEASANVYRKIVFNLPILSSSSGSIAPVPLSSEFRLRVTVLGDYVDPRDFNQTLNQTARPTHRDLTITNNANIKNLFAENSNQVWTTWSAKEDPSFPSGLKPPEVSIHEITSDPWGSYQPLSTFLVADNITRIRNLRSLEFYLGASSLFVNTPFLYQSSLTNPVLRARELSELKFLNTPSPVDNFFLAVGIPPSVNSSFAHRRPILQYNAAEDAWQAGLTTEADTSLQDQTPYRTKLFSSAYNLARLSQPASLTSSPSYVGAIPVKDSKTSTTLQFDSTFRFLVESNANVLLEKVLSGMSVLFIGDRHVFRPENSRRHSLLTSRSLNIGYRETTRPDQDLDEDVTTGTGPQTRISLWSGVGQSAFRSVIEKTIPGNLVFLQRNSSQGYSWLRVSPMAEEVSLSSSQALRLESGNIDLHFTTLTSHDTYIPSNASVETKTYDPSGWSFKSNRLDHYALMFSQTIRGSLRSQDVGSSGSPHLKAALVNVSEPRYSTSSVRISLRTLWEFLFNPGDSNPVDPILGGTPYTFNLTGRYNPFVSNPTYPFSLRRVDEFIQMYLSDWENGVDSSGGLLYHMQSQTLALHYRVDEVDYRKADKGGFHLGQLQIDRKPAFGREGQFDSPQAILDESSSPYFTEKTTYLGADGKWHYLFHKVVVPVEA